MFGGNPEDQRWNFLILGIWGTDDEVQEMAPFIVIGDTAYSGLCIWGFQEKGRAKT